MNISHDPTVHKFCFGNIQGDPLPFFIKTIKMLSQRNPRTKNNGTSQKYRDGLIPFRNDLGIESKDGAPANKMDENPNSNSNR